MALNVKQRTFVEHYLQTFNASEAARRAGYSEKTAYAIGHELLKKPEIEAEIKNRLEDLTMTTDEILKRLTDQARSNVADYWLFQQGYASGLNWKAIEEKGQSIIKKVKVTHQGMELELYDAQAAMVHIAKLRGEYVERSDQTLHIEGMAEALKRVYGDQS
jgi:phage terminase small subunit